MANTGNLKSIEESLIKAFCSKEGCVSAILSHGERLKIFGNMLPDLVAFGMNKLHIGEITSSGYYGKNGRDFHIGATRKLGEAFIKLYIYKKEIDEILARLRSKINLDGLESVNYHFIVPEGSRFIQGLGYRKRIFQDDFVKLTALPINEDDMAILKEVNDRARIEMEKEREEG